MISAEHHSYIEHICQLVMFMCGWHRKIAAMTELQDGCFNRISFCCCLSSVAVVTH